MEEIDAFVINYNGRRTILDTIRSIYEMKEVEVKVHVMDDSSADGSVEMVRRKYPEIDIHRNARNVGKPSGLRNQAIRLARTPRIFITDNDVLFDLYCLDELLKVMKNDGAIAACKPRLMYWQEPERVYSGGSQVHFIGASIDEERDRILGLSDSGGPTIHCGGGIMLLDRMKALEVGGFDEDYMMGWGEDGEFYQRLMICGHKSYYVPRAVGLHEFKPFDEQRLHRAVGQVYNRWLYILTHYSLRTILLLIPTFLLYEFLQFAFLITKRLGLAYVKGNWRVLRNVSTIVRKRRRIQAMKILSDKAVLYSGPLYVRAGLMRDDSISKLGIKALNVFLDTYWRAVKGFVG